MQYFVFHIKARRFYPPKQTRNKTNSSNIAFGLFPFSFKVVNAIRVWRDGDLLGCPTFGAEKVTRQITDYLWREVKIANPIHKAQFVFVLQPLFHHIGKNRLPIITVDIDKRTAFIIIQTFLHPIKCWFRTNHSSLKPMGLILGTQEIRQI